LPVVELLVTRPDTAPQQLHLGPAVVVVVLPVDIPAGPIEKRCDGVPERRLAPVAKVEGPGGVRRDELHHHPASGTLIAPAEASVLRENRVERRCYRSSAEAEVEEARSGHLDRSDPCSLQVEARGDVLRDHPGRPAEPLCQRHRHVRRKITEGGVARPFQAHRGIGDAQLGQHAADGSSDRVLRHAIRPSRSRTRCRSPPPALSSQIRSRFRPTPSSCIRCSDSP
jgi:hypothetical protein